jgi:hypothetical protein
MASKMRVEGSQLTRNPKAPQPVKGEREEVSQSLVSAPCPPLT